MLQNGRNNSQRKQRNPILKVKKGKKKKQKGHNEAGKIRPKASELQRPIRLSDNLDIVGQSG